MTRGGKAYFIITSVVAAIAAIIDFLAVTIFLSIVFGGGSPLGNALSLVIFGVYYIVFGGIVSAVAFIMSCVLIKVSRKLGLIYLITIFLLFAVGILCFVVCGNSNSDSESALLSLIALF